MMLTAAPLPRRTFLRGLGAGMALPLLDSMGPTLAFSNASRLAPPPIRLGYVYTPNGIVGCSSKSPRPFMWTPRRVGANVEFSPTMKPLEPYRGDLVVFSGLAQANGRALGDGPGDHARATATFLTGVHPYKTGGADFRLGVSADQIAAKALGAETPLASLELGLEQPPLAGNCDSGYTCAYMAMSWRSETSPCQPRPTRDWSSNGCSAMTRPPTPRFVANGWRISGACSTTCRAAWRGCSGASASATAASWTSTSSQSVTSSAAFR